MKGASRSRVTAFFTAEVRYIEQSAAAAKSMPEPYSRPIVTYQELVFGPGPRNRGLQLYFHANSRFARVDCSKGTKTVISGGSRSQPAVGPGGDVYVSIAGSLHAYAPDGTKKWSFGAVPRNVMSSAAPAPNGTVHVVRNLAYLHALRPDNGSSLWKHTDLSMLDRPVVSPRNHVVLATGRINFGYPGFIRAVNPKGALEWQVDLPRESGDVVAMTGARFTRDGNTAYFGTAILGNNRYCYVYALDTGTPHRAAAWNYGKGCYGSGGYLNLAFTGLPALGRGFSVELSRARPSATGVHLLGLSSHNLDLTWKGAPGCSVYAAPDAVLPVTTDSSGRATTRLVVPNVPALLGFKLYHQFGVSDPINRLQVVTTNGGGTVLGR